MTDQLLLPVALTPGADPRPIRDVEPRDVRGPCCLGADGGRWCCTYLGNLFDPDDPPTTAACRAHKAPGQRYYSTPLARDSRGRPLRCAACLAEVER